MSAPVPARPARTEPRSLTDLLASVDGLSSAGGPVDGVHVLGVTHDSQQVRPGDLFAALPGQRHHGAAFSVTAATNGAAAVLTDDAGVPAAAETGLPVIRAYDARLALGPVARWLYDDPSAQMLVIGVTGTNGKTTTAYLLEAGMRASGHSTGLIGTVETRVGDGSVASLHTTPEATDLQALFAVMVEHGTTAVAMEVSSHALALDRVDGTTFEVAVFTNLSQDHLDFHRDIEDYFAAKARLFATRFTKLAVIDVDDGYGARLASETAVRAVTVSPLGDDSADWWVDSVGGDSAGSTFVLHGPGGIRATARVRLPGRFNVANAALAVVALVEAGVPIARAIDGVGSCAHVPGRMQRVDAGQQFLAIVDYAHTPDAVASLLASIRPIPPARLIAVLGCGGDRDRAKRPLMGAAVARGADIAVLTSDNPRSEDPVEILAEMKAGAGDVAATDRADLYVEPDRRVAIRRAVSLARTGDVVVIAGKGHERVQEIAGQRLPFDDVDELHDAIGSAVRAS